MKFFYMVLVALSFSCFGCRKDQGDKQPESVRASFAGKSYTILDAGTLTTSDTEIAGSGSIVFDSPLAFVSSRTNFALRFALDAGGSLELVAHCDSDLEKGVSIIISRADAKLFAQLKVAGFVTAAKELIGISVHGTIALAMETRNEVDPAVILIWDASKNDFSENVALLNSKNDGGAPGQGKGTDWGLKLISAVVYDAKYSE